MFPKFIELRNARPPNWGTLAGNTAAAHASVKMQADPAPLRVLVPVVFLVAYLKWPHVGGDKAFLKCSK